MSLFSPRLELLITSRCTLTLGVSNLDCEVHATRVLRRKSSWASVSLWDQSCSPMIQVRYFSGLSIVNFIFSLYCACNDICFVFFFFCNIVHETVLNASSNGKLFLSSLTVRRRTWRHKSQIKSVKIRCSTFFK